MTYKEENIVNIAMQAATMLKDGRIGNDCIDGHMGMTQEILNLAEEFERINKSEDYDALGRDYWLEIDEFSERKLLELFGREQDHSIQAPATVYLFPQPENTYRSVAAASNEPLKGAIPLVEEKDYPVSVFYARSDLNGSTCMECDHCNNLSDLLSTLDWCGKCRYTIYEIWDFDLEKTENPALENLFENAYLHRMKLIDKEIDEMSSDTHAPHSSLDGQILDAQQRTLPATNCSTPRNIEPSVNH